MFWIMVIIALIVIWIILASLDELIERQKVMEYEQVRQFKELSEKLDFMDSDVQEVKNSVNELGYKECSSKPLSIDDLE